MFYIYVHMYVYICICPLRRGIIFCCYWTAYGLPIQYPHHKVHFAKSSQAASTTANATVCSVDVGPRAGMATRPIGPDWKFI